ncbi:MAG: hypothetical protein H0V12_10420 [Chloroflexi bacterium]|nr:hypothetical protein [Chloroflexota bacterium]
MREASGAKLFVYLGHGNGWPSPYGPFQEKTKNGLGLNPYEGGSSSNVKYYGADHIRSNVNLAPDSVVVLNRLCYASGNGESGHGIPSRSVAVQRVDNYANGFLAAGAGVVFAYGWQPATSIVKLLFSTEGSMDDVFMTPERTRGWTGWRHSYFNSARMPGERGHLDPYSDAGYLRSVIGDLRMTTAEFMADGTADAPAPSEPTPTPTPRPTPTPPPPVEDTVAPTIRAFTAIPSADTPVPAGGHAVLTPNGDGLSDRLRLRYRLSEAATVTISVEDAQGSIVRTFAIEAEQGLRAITWRGLADDGTLVPDGTYRIHARAADRAGNLGEPVQLKAVLLTSLHDPSAAPGALFSRDEDSLAQGTRLSTQLTTPAQVTWQIRNASGSVVLTRLNGRNLDSGGYSWRWTGRGTSGTHVRDGVYTSVVTATTDQGAVTHVQPVVVAAFDVSRSEVRPSRGQRVTFTLVSTEPLRRAPTLRIWQPGVDTYQVTTARIGPQRYRVSVKLKSGGSAGRTRIRIYGRDSEGQAQRTYQTFQID